MTAQDRVPTVSVLDEARCRGLLESSTVGRVAFVGREGIVLRPVNYRVAAGDVVFRVSVGGALREVVEEGREVVFEVDHYAPSGQSGGWSVLVRGACTVGERPELFETPGVHHPVPWGSIGETVLVTLRPSVITGRAVWLTTPAPDYG